jgi:FkbM family methyltransferase
MNTPSKATPLLPLLRLARNLFKGTKIQHLKLTSLVYSYLVKKVFSNADTLVVNFRGQDLVVEGRDITLLPTLIDQTYEKYEIDWFLRLITTNSSKKLFIDVGANIGIYATLATRYAQNNVYCIAIEPDSRNLVKLETNIAKNGLTDRVRILPCAVGVVAADLSENSERKFFISQYGATSRLASLEENSENSNVMFVQVLTLSQVIKNFYNDTYDLVVIKVDVEGFEPEVLVSGFEFIRRIKPFLLVEFSTDSSREYTVLWTLDFLTQLFDIYSKVEVIERNQNCLRIYSPADFLEIAPSKLVNLIFTP